MNAMSQLEQAGYEFDLKSDGTIGYAYRGAEPPVDSWVRPLLLEIREHRQEVAAILAARTSSSSSTEAEVFTRKTRRYVIFPADTTLPFPAGSWRCLDDGRIEALLSYAELEKMRYWRDEILQ